ncbi:unnamed protein product [Trichogramma brassicae]|uniref:Reverse transcriptase domain-containing protein n=1 Tax=Trichogramma brassicae TaxID=86971 RepID=A0A6H5IHK1_9HYME|nr:unnamed protein product [Trichogramma brassicae]
MQNQTLDRLKMLYPMVNEEDTPLPKSWSSKDKYNYIGLSQNNLRVHYKDYSTIIVLFEKLYYGILRVKIGDIRAHGFVKKYYFDPYVFHQIQCFNSIRIRNREKVFDVALLLFMQQVPKRRFWARVCGKRHECRPCRHEEINIDFSCDGLSLFVVDETAVGGRVVTGALLDLTVATLSSALIAASDLVAPLSAPQPASRQKPWVTSQIRDLSRERDRAYRLFRRGRSCFAAYKELRSRVRNLLDTAKNQHLASRVAGAVDVQSRWCALCSMGVSSPRLPSPLASFSADELCSHYIAVGFRAPPLDISMATAAIPAERHVVFNFRHVTEDEVRLTMARCVARSFGLDGISSTILRLSSPSILRVVTRIVNASMDLGYFPVSWKTAAVIPLAKGNSVALPSDTRPISLLSELSKIVEQIIHAQLSEYLFQNGLIDPGQHGFRPDHSTTTALLEITERARRAIDRREVSVLVSFDFSKAFDTIDHTILIRKLICAGCSDGAIEWFLSYLGDRSVCVRLEDGTHTEPRAVTSAIIPGLNIGDLLRDVTRDANAVCEWVTTNGLTCNAAKTKVMLIGSLSFVTSLRPKLPARLNIGGEIVPFTKEIKTLGVFLSGKFNWDRQIALMTSKVHHSLYALRFYKHALSRKMRLMLVGALVAPHLDYPAPLLTDLTKEQTLALQRLPNACIRFIYGTIPRMAHVTPYRLALGWLSAGGRREVINCSLASRILRDASPGYLRRGFRVIEVRTETEEIRQSARRRPSVLYYKAPGHRTIRSLICIFICHSNQ